MISEKTRKYLEDKKNKMAYILATRMHKVKEIGEKVPAKGGRYQKDLESLVEMEVTNQGKRFVIRSTSKGTGGSVFQVVGVALPPTIRMV